MTDRISDEIVWTYACKTGLDVGRARAILEKELAERELAEKAKEQIAFDERIAKAIAEHEAESQVEESESVLPEDIEEAETQLALLKARHEEEKLNEKLDALDAEAAKEQADLEEEYDDKLDELTEEFAEKLKVHKVKVEEALKATYEEARLELQKNAIIKIQETVTELNAQRAQLNLQFNQQVQKNLEKFEQDLTDIIYLLTIEKFDKITLTIFRTKDGIQMQISGE